MIGEPIISVPCIETPHPKDESSSMDMADHCKEKLDNGSIFITTDKEHHDAGDTVVITGCVVDSISSGDLSVQIINPENNVIKTSTLAPGIDGSFDTEYVIDEEFGLDGKYSAAVSLGNNSSTKTSPSLNLDHLQ